MHTKECVLAIPTVDLAEKVVGIGDCSGAKVNKFQKFGLTALPATDVKAPLISECLACLECRVIDYLESQGIFILKGVRAWVDQERKERRTFHANGDGTFIVDGNTINLRSLMEDKLSSGV
jgi:flavin reductase (DIM6/NTAB) family NADH-FMN oxidoreductase RutF